MIAINPKMLYRFEVRRNQRLLAPARELTRIFDFTWVKPVCCLSKISSNCGCQSKEIGVGMEVRLISVGTRVSFSRRFATRLRGL